MSNVNNSHGRRSFLAAAGSASAAIVAGCTQSGDDGGDGDGGDGGDGGGGGGATPTPRGTPTATPEPPSYRGKGGITAFEMGAMPVVTAFRETLAARTDDRFTGILQNFGRSQLIVQAQISGSVNAGVYSPGNAFNANIAGNDLRSIMTTIAGTDYVLSADVEKVPEDGVDGLRYVAENGLKFGLGGRGGLSHIQPVAVMRREGIDTDQVNWVQIGGSSDRTRSLAAGRIAVAALHLEQHQRLASQGGVNVKMLVDFRDYFPNMVQEALWVTERFLSNDLHDAFAQELVTAIIQNNQRASNDFEWIFRKTQKYQANPLSREEAEATYRELETMNAWPTELTTAGYQSALDQMAAGDLVDPSQVDLDGILLTEYAENAQADL